MKQSPQAQDLLVVARDMLREQLMPHLPPAQRHVAMMIASAMAIAARQCAQGEAHERTELAALEALFGAHAVADSVAPQARLAAYLVLLCQHIRDADDEAALAGIHAHLLATTRAVVAESNPKYLGNAP
jgi:hypothetical protein